MLKFKESYQDPLAGCRQVTALRRLGLMSNRDGHGCLTSLMVFHTPEGLLAFRPRGTTHTYRRTELLTCCFCRAAKSQLLDLRHVPVLCKVNRGYGAKLDETKLSLRSRGFKHRMPLGCESSGLISASLGRLRKRNNNFNISLTYFLFRFWYYESIERI